MGFNTAYVSFLDALNKVFVIDTYHIYLLSKGSVLEFFRIESLQKEKRSDSLN